MARTDKAGSQQWTAVSSLLKPKNEAKICKASPKVMFGISKVFYVVLALQFIV